MRMIPVEFFREAQRLANQYECLIIADEVAIGFGRTGEMFASDKIGLKPDFLCLSKGITNGTLPFAATLTTQDIYNTFYSKENTFYHGHTYTANPIGCAAGLASLQVFNDEHVLTHVNEILIPSLSIALEQIKGHPNCHNVRQCGTIAAFELKRQNGKSFQEGANMAKEFCKNLLKEGIVCRPLGETLYYFLPLCTTQDQLNQIVCKTVTVLQKQFNI